jgi:ribosome-associated toxin RatA of RatAB toxin-antitoxin module/heme-degrading monooxygenase HmoA
MSNQENRRLTLINVFPVEPHNQQELVDILTHASTQTMRYQPGFLSARVYRGVSGTYVANCVEWRSQEDFTRMWRQPQVQQHVADVHGVAKGNPQIFELCGVIEGVVQEAANGGGVQPNPVLSVEHDIVISKSWEQCFELCACLDRWPEFMPAVHKARILRESNGDQEIELTANFGSEVVSWRSRREILLQAQKIRFWSLTPRHPIKALAGVWFFEPSGQGQTRVRVAHEFELADLAQEAAVRARISQNMIGDLNGMKNYMETKV